MRTYRTATTTYTEIDQIICDGCGSVISISESNAFDCDVKITTGYTTLDGGAGVRTTFDFCEKCATEKVLPLLKSIAPDVKDIEWDW